MQYYKDQNGQPVIRENATNEEGLTQITKAEYEALLHKQEVCIQLNELKFELKRTDYIVLKIAEAETEEEKAAIREEYAQVIAHRKEIRIQINQLEGELN